MDYPYFAAAPHPHSQYQFLGQPPTPAHTNSANSDEFSASPPDAFDQFQSFDYSQFTPNNIPQPNIAQPKPPTPQRHTPSVSVSHGYEAPLDMNDDATRRGSNSDDDENMPPAQARRKAQNRAAQRAFRERKERHVKDLEAKLAALEQNTTSLTSENSRLKAQLQAASTENEILKATSSSSPHAQPNFPDTGPMHFSPTDFYTEVLHAHENKVPSHRIVVSEGGQRLMGAGATWDFILKHPLYERGLVDVGAVSERLKGVARCDGQGPVFEEGSVVEAIERSVASGSDELL